MILDDMYRIFIFSPAFLHLLLLYSGKYGRRYLIGREGEFSGSGGRIEARWRPPGVATEDLWKHFGASSGSHGVLESFVSKTHSGNNGFGSKSRQGIRVYVDCKQRIL